MREVKTAQLNIRVMPEQLRDIRVTAALAGKTVTDWLIDLAELEIARTQRRLARNKAARGEETA